jgi:hypothetical protein
MGTGWRRLLQPKVRPRLDVENSPSFLLPVAIKIFNAEVIGGYRVLTDTNLRKIETLLADLGLNPEEVCAFKPKQAKAFQRHSNRKKIGWETSEVW